MITTTNLLNRIQEFASRKGRFSINVTELFSLISDIVKKIGNVISGASISMIYQPDVDDLSKLKQIKNPKKGWAARVMNQVNENGHAYIYQFDGGAWNRTPFVAFPDDVVTRKDLEDRIRRISGYVDKEVIIGKDMQGIDIYRRPFSGVVRGGTESNEATPVIEISIKGEVRNLWVDNNSYVMSHDASRTYPFKGLSNEKFPGIIDGRDSFLPRIEARYNKAAPQLTLKAFDIPSTSNFYVHGFVCYTRE